MYSNRVRKLFKNLGKKKRETKVKLELIRQPTSPLPTPNQPLELSDARARNIN